MVRLFRREHTADELLTYALGQRDFRAAAVIIATGAAEVLEQITEECPDAAHQPDRVLARALQKVTATD